jgi:hypothetical protein
LSNRLRRRSRHLFLPYVPFIVSVRPQGERTPSYLEQAVLLLIEGRHLAENPLPIDELIIQLALGEPAGRELINGLWRKGWILINGREGTVHLSQPMRLRIDKDGAADFSGLGTGELPIQRHCCFDLITGRAFVLPLERRDEVARPPYIIQPFYPESASAPYGVPMLGYLDLDQKDLIEALRVHDEFRQLLATSNSLTVKVVPPESIPSQRDVQFLRLFFQVERDHNNKFTLTSAENRYPALAQLGASVAGPVSERALNVESPLRTKFLDEEPVTEGRRTRHARGHLQLAVERFGQVENAGGDAAIDSYNEARLITQQGLSLIQGMLQQVASRQVTVNFLASRQQVDEAATNILKTFGRQAILISQTAALEQLNRRIGDAEASSAGEARRALLIQTAGRMSTDRTNTMRRAISRLGNLASEERTGATQVFAKFASKGDAFVDTPLLIGDADDVLLSSASLLDSLTVAANGFHIKLYAPQREAVALERSSTLSAATDLIDAVYPTFFAPSPIRNLCPSKRAPKTTGESALEKRLTTLRDDLSAETAATPETPNDAEAIRQPTPLEVAQFRELSRLRKTELDVIANLLQNYEREVPVIATGVSDTAIFDTGCALLLQHEAKKPFYVGIRPNEVPDPEFTEVIETLFETNGCEDGHLVFLGEADETWNALRSKWQKSYAPRLTVHAPDSASDAQRVATFMPFIIGTAGCLLASGGITNRVFVAPRRKDKMQVGLELKGSECHAAPLKMLANLLPHEPELQAEDFSVARRNEDTGLLSSTLYRRWLQSTTIPRVGSSRTDAATNLGAPVLVAPLLDEPKLYEKCLADAKLIGNRAYEKAVVKASVIAKLQSHDAYAAWLWDSGRIFEASVFARDSSRDHPLAQPALRALICNLSLPRDISDIPEIESEWLRHDEVLALSALNLLHPIRRRMLAEVLPDSFPPGPLGAFVHALLMLARVSDDEPLTWTKSEGPELAYAPAAYSEFLRTSLSAFEKDWKNKEANDIQVLARERFVPLRVMLRLVHERERVNTAAEADEAVRILTKEYGGDYAKAIGTKGKRENIARNLVEDLDEISRSKHVQNRVFVGGKKLGMITSIARFLEVLQSLAALGNGNVAQTRVAERDAVRKAADLWIKTAPAAEDATPRALLHEIALSSGRAAPNGEIDFALWRYPALLEALRKPGKFAPSMQAMAAAIMHEEWPYNTGSAAVFEHLFHTRRYNAAEYLLEICESRGALTDNAEATQENAQRRLRLTDRMEQEAREFVDRARELEVDAAQLSLVDLQQDANEYGELFLGLGATARDVEEGQALLSEIRAKINASAAARLTHTTMAAFAPWPRQLALAHYDATAEAFATERPQAAGSVGTMLARLREFDPGDDFTPRRACDHLRITRSTAAIRFFGAAKFSLCGRSHATDEEIHEFVRELDTLVAGGVPAPDAFSIDQTDHDSGSAHIGFPGGGLATWLNWQVPEYELRVLFSEQFEDRTLAQMGLAEGPLPVFINPFRLAPRIKGDHLLINLGEILAALTMARPKDALVSAVVHKAALSTLVPWDDSLSLNEKARHLARLISTAPDEVVRRLPPAALAPALRTLLERLRIELTLESRPAFETVEASRRFANHCLAFMSGGHLVDAFDIIRRARLHGQGGPSVLPVNSFLSGLRAEAELRQQAANNFARWQANQPGEEKTDVSGKVTRACTDIWTVQPTAVPREHMMRHLSERLDPEDKRAPALLIGWMVDETVLLEDKDGTLRPNPAHPFASIRF